MKFTQMIKLNFESSGNITLHEKRRVLFINELLVISFVSSFLLSTFLLYHEMALLASISMLLMPCCLISFYLNHQGHKYSPSIVYTGAICVITLAMDYVAHFQLDTHLLLLAFLPLSNLTLPRHSKKAYLNLSLFIIICAVAVFLSRWSLHDLSSQVMEKQLNLALLVLSSFIFILGTYLSKRFHNQYYNELVLSQYKHQNNNRISDLGRMTAGIAHEINNPLAIIRTSAHFALKRIKRGDLSEERHQKELQRIIDQVDRTVKIVNDLGEVSKTLPKGKCQEIEINTTLNKVFHLCQQRFVNLGINYEIEIPKELILCDIPRPELEQIILSLLSNAMDAVENNDYKQITLKLSQKGNFAIIEISDNGVGIPIEFKDQVLKPFFTTKPLGKGIGLGLSVSCEIIEKYAGSLSFQTTNGLTIFTISFPLVEDSENLEVA